jgi:hypothetical protein
VASVLAVSSLLLAGVAPAIGQETGLGAEVPFVDTAGVTRGTIEVRELHDPFPDHDPSRPAGEGSRYIGLIVAFTAADDQQMDANPNHVLLHDTDGDLFAPTYVPRPADVVIPDLQAQTMAPGNRVSGFIGYVVPGDATIDEVLYQPDTSRSIVLVDQIPGGGPAAGETVAYVAGDGSSADITVTIDDPFTGFEPNQPPAAGTRYVSLLVAVESTGQARFKADPYQFLLHDTDGNLVYSSWVPRPTGDPLADLEAQTMSPGDRVSGRVGFSVPEGAVLQSVDYQPSGSRRVVIADLTGGAPVEPGRSPAPAASAAPVATEPPTPTAAPVASAAATQPAASAGTAQ